MKSYRSRASERVIYHRRVSIPVEVLWDRDLTMGARMLYCLMVDSAWKDETMPSEESLARTMGCDIATVCRHLAELNEHMLISWREVERGRTVFDIEDLDNRYSGNDVIERGRS